MSHVAPDLSSGALLLERVKTGAGSQCSEENCIRVGRYRIRIAGHYLHGEGRLQRYTFLCPRHVKAAVELWDELTGRADDEDASEEMAA